MVMIKRKQIELAEATLLFYPLLNQWVQVRPLLWWPPLRFANCWTLIVYAIKFARNLIAC